MSMEQDNILKKTLGSYYSIILNVLAVYAIYFLCRIVFYVSNLSFYEQQTDGSVFFNIIKGGFFFDTSAIIYTNLLYFILAALPLHIKEPSKTYSKVLKYVFVITNSIAIISNFVDCVYFRYTGRRTTSTVFDEFKNEDNITGIVFKEIANSWYLVFIAAIFILALVIVYRKNKLFSVTKPTKNFVTYYGIRLIFLVIIVLLSIIGIRGGIDRSTRPIALSNASQYVKRPVETALVLNTPFSIIRTIGNKPFITPEYFNADSLESIYTPLHQPSTPDSIARGKGKNVVVFIIESFAKEYIGALNPRLEGGNYKGYTPFTDSLVNQSLTFEYSYCNGRKSIDAMPSILSSIPYFVEPFFLTPAALNDLSGIARELKSEGYYSAFFHGAKNGSMGFEAFANATGFDDYYGRTEFDMEEKYGGEKEFDGFWAIWDEPFFQFYADKMNEFKQPFVTAMFSASSHHPFNIPHKYKDIYPEENLPIHKCIRYTDNALRNFFNTAKQYDWYNNSIFVICNDHTNQSDHQEYQTDLGTFGGTIIFYSPGDSLLIGHSNKIAQQIDVMPTILSYLGYQKPYISFGCDLLTTPEDQTFAVSYNNGIYQYVKNGYLLQFNGEKTTAVYKLDDIMLKNNLLGQVSEQNTMEKEIKAIVQQYMQRMNENNLIAK